MLHHQKEKKNRQKLYNDHLMLIVNNDNRMIHQYQIDVHQSYVKPFQHDYLIFFKKNLIEIYSYFEENFHFFKIENRFKKKILNLMIYDDANRW